MISFSSNIAHNCHCAYSSSPFQNSDTGGDTSDTYLEVEILFWQKIKRILTVVCFTRCGSGHLFLIYCENHHHISHLYNMSVSHFQEKSGTVPCKTPWGRWWQSVQEVAIEVELTEGTRAKDVKVDVKPNYIKCMVKGTVTFEGKLCRTVVTDETTWTVEEQKLLYIQLTKADPICKEIVWTSLLEGQYIPDAWTFGEMQKKIDLEKFQIENPGFDFSNAKLSKAYDNIIPESR